MAQYRLEESLNSLDADSSSYSYSYKRDQCPKSPSPTLNTVASFSVCLRPCRDAGVVVVVVVVVVFVVVVVVVVVVVCYCRLMCFGRCGAASSAWTKTRLVLATLPKFTW